MFPNYDNHVHKVSRKIEDIAMDFIVDKDLPRQYYERQRQEAHRALMRVAFGATYTETLEHQFEECIGQTFVPASAFSHLCTLLPEDLQFGWLKPTYRTIVTKRIWQVRTKVEFPNTPVHYNSRTFHI